MELYKEIKRYINAYEKSICIKNFGLCLIRCELIDLQKVTKNIGKTENSILTH